MLGNRLSIVMAIIFALFLISYTAGDALAFEGVPLSDTEMEAIHGGFQMPNGNFIYFSMDVTRMEYMAYNDPGSMTSTGGWENISLISAPGVSGSISGNVTHNIGLTNVAYAFGNNIRQCLINDVDIRVGFFRVSSADMIKPILSNWTHLVF